MTAANSLFPGLPLKSKARQTVFYWEFCNQTPKPGRLGWIFGSKARQTADPLCSFLFTFLISSLPQFDIAREGDIVLYLKQGQNTWGEILVPLGDWGGRFWQSSTLLSLPLRSETRVTSYKVPICWDFPAPTLFSLPSASCSHPFRSVSVCTGNL